MRVCGVFFKSKRSFPFVNKILRAILGFIYKYVLPRRAYKQTEGCFYHSFHSATTLLCTNGGRDRTGCHSHSVCHHAP